MSEFAFVTFPALPLLVKLTVRGVIVLAFVASIALTYQILATYLLPTLRLVSTWL